MVVTRGTLQGRYLGPDKQRPQPDCWSDGVLPSGRVRRHGRRRYHGAPIQRRRSSLREDVERPLCLSNLDLNLSDNSLMTSVGRRTLPGNTADRRAQSTASRRQGSVEQETATSTLLNAES